MLAALIRLRMWTDLLRLDLLIGTPWQEMMTGFPWLEILTALLGLEKKTDPVFRPAEKSSLACHGFYSLANPGLGCCAPANPGPGCCSHANPGLGSCSLANPGYVDFLAHAQRTVQDQVRSGFVDQETDHVAMDIGNQRETVSDDGCSSAECSGTKKNCNSLDIHSWRGVAWNTA